jgi:hypothetical protein
MNLGKMQKTNKEINKYTELKEDGNYAFMPVNLCMVK